MGRGGTEHCAGAQVPLTITVTNAQTHEGTAMSMTPLHWYVNMNACSREDIEELLDAGADTSLKNSQGDTPLDMVAKVCRTTQ